MKSALQTGLFGVDMPPLPNDIWQGVGLLQLTEEPTFSGTCSETLVTWQIPENQTVTTTAADPQDGTIRWYDPITGRWLSKDPIGISGGLNQYVFVGNNPVNFRDPFGLCKKKEDPLKGTLPWFAKKTPWKDLRGPYDKRANVTGWFDPIRGPIGHTTWDIFGTFDQERYVTKRGIYYDTAYHKWFYKEGETTRQARTRERIIERGGGKAIRMYTGRGDPATGDTWIGAGPEGPVGGDID